MRGVGGGVDSVNTSTAHVQKIGSSPRALRYWGPNSQRCGPDSHEVKTENLFLIVPMCSNSIPVLVGTHREIVTTIKLTRNREPYKDR